MQKSFHSLLIASVMTFGALCAQGSEANAQAIVLAVKGSVTAVMAGQAATPVKVGDRLPVGAVITTAPDSETDIQVFNGAVATVRSDTTCALEKLSVTASGGVVTKQTALIDLKVGTIASNIDPANHNINDYGIRTPKGVAAARGTVYVVNVKPNGKTQVFVTNSAVTFTINVTDAAGNKTTSTVTIPAGTQVTVSNTGVVSQTTLTPEQLQQANKDAKPSDDNSVKGGDDTKGSTPPAPPVIILDPKKTVSPSST